MASTASYYCASDQMFSAAFDFSKSPGYVNWKVVHWDLCSDEVANQLRSLGKGSPTRLFAASTYVRKANICFSATIDVSRILFTGTTAAFPESKGTENKALLGMWYSIPIGGTLNAPRLTVGVSCSQS